MKWKWIQFDGAVPHAVPETLEGGIIEDLVGRDCDVRDVQEIEGTSIDFPGVVSMTRPWQSFMLDEFRIEIPCEDVEDMFEALSGLSARHTRAGEVYYKLHGFMRCIVFTPADREELLFQMADAIPEANGQAQKFYSGRMTPSQVLHEASGFPEGSFPDRLARFQDDEDVN